jgi:hypothetical protein
MTMTTTMTEIRELDRDEMAGVEGGISEWDAMAFTYSRS